MTALINEFSPVLRVKVPTSVGALAPDPKATFTTLPGEVLVPK
jgi:hypothetical protein